MYPEADFVSVAKDENAKEHLYARLASGVDSDTVCIHTPDKIFFWE